MSELTHYGVLGMKWGKRRYQNKDGSLTPAGVKRYATKGFAEDSYNENKTIIGKAYDKYTGAHKLDGKMTYALNKKTGNDDDNKARAEKYLKDQENTSKAKSDYKYAKTAKTRDAVKEYDKKYEEYLKADEDEFIKSIETTKQYKSLGKTKIGRVIAAARNKTPEAKKYNQMMDEVIKAAEISEQKWNAASEAYKKTGKNRVTRVINNIKYRK